MPTPLDATKILQRRPMGPVPMDDEHRWLDYPLTRFQARENFTRAWERLGIPFTLIDLYGNQVDAANDDLPVTIYAHQHVKLTPVLGRWCCASAAEPSVSLSSVYHRECIYCERPAKVKGMCWMHYSRMARHGDPYLARPYNMSQPRHNYPTRVAAGTGR